MSLDKVVNMESVEEGDVVRFSFMFASGKQAHFHVGRNELDPLPDGVTTLIKEFADGLK